MAAEKWYAIWSSSALGDGDDGEGSTTTGLPIDSKVLGIRLDQVGVPGVLRDPETVIGVLAFCGLAKDMAWHNVSMLLRAPVGSCGVLRYLDARTKRPAIVVCVWQNLLEI